MPALIDTNVLLRSMQPSHTMYASAVNAVQSLLKKDRLFVAVQNVAELWNVATRPVKYNGLGMSIAEAQAELAKIERVFTVLYETPVSYAMLKTLLNVHNVIGVQVHDTRLVSVMQSHGIAEIVTFNVQDFTRFTGITAVHPDTV